MKNSGFRDFKCLKLLGKLLQTGRQILPGESALRLPGILPFFGFERRTGQFLPTPDAARRKNSPCYFFEILRFFLNSVGQAAILVIISPAENRFKHENHGSRRRPRVGKTRRRKTARLSRGACPNRPPLRPHPPETARYRWTIRPGNATQIEPVSFHPFGRHTQ